MSWLAQNRAFLATYDPELLAELAFAKCDDLQRQLTRRGMPTLSCRLKMVHSKIDPVKEAQRVVGSSKADLHIHFGLGLGYFLQADIESRNTLVFEPHPGMILTALEELDMTALLEARGAKICVGLSRFHELLAEHWPASAQVKWVVSPFHKLAYPKVLATLQQAVQALRLRHNNAQKTIKTLLPCITASSLRSLAYAGPAPSIAALADCFKGQPAILISPGPSLNKQVPVLRQLHGRALVIAGARSVQALQLQDIKPHILIHNEARPYLHLLKNATNLTETVGVLADQCHVSMYRYFQGRSFVYRHPLNPVSTWLGKAQPHTRHETLATGGSVATEAFSLAHFMGCNPIILVGQDLALDQGQRYADQSETPSTACTQLTGVWRQPVSVPLDYLSFVYWFRDHGLRMRKSDPSLQLVNSSQGVRLHGFDHQCLADVMQRLPQQPQAFSKVLRQATKTPLLQPSDLQPMMRQGIDQCETMQQICQLFFASQQRGIVAAGDVAALEEKLFKLRTQASFVEGFALDLLENLQQKVSTRSQAVAQFFQTYLNAAAQSAHLLRCALAEYETAHAAQNVNGTDSQDNPS